MSMFLVQMLGIVIVIAIVIIGIYAMFINNIKIPEDIKLTKEDRKRMKEIGFDTYESHRDYLNDLMGYKYLK